MKIRTIELYTMMNFSEKNVKIYHLQLGPIYSKSRKFVLDKVQVLYYSLYLLLLYSPSLLTKHKVIFGFLIFLCKNELQKILMLIFSELSSITRSFLQVDTFFYTKVFNLLLWDDY